ncbi:hypothetical protein KP78_13530 [Jeotgalibacillus soli]|uniref:Uncharacterized protein n=1 Tax=Jeotgalibacillus soli TaxID=889306 RepID=A0A0C2RI95_9BACL|nr:hypothetical protein KP78_13530 [Jeotgalibacillus soli]
MLKDDSDSFQKSCPVVVQSEATNMIAIPIGYKFFSFDCAMLVT